MFLGSPQTVQLVENKLSPMQGWFDEPILFCTPSDIFSEDPYPDQLDHRGLLRLFDDVQKRLCCYVNAYGENNAGNIIDWLIGDPFANYVGRVMSKNPFYIPLPKCTAPNSRTFAGFVYVADCKTDAQNTLSSVSGIPSKYLAGNAGTPRLWFDFFLGHEVSHLLRMKIIFPGAKAHWDDEHFSKCGGFNTSGLHKETTGDLAGLYLADASPIERQLILDARAIGFAREDFSFRQYDTALPLTYFFKEGKIPNFEEIVEGMRGYAWMEGEVLHPRRLAEDLPIVLAQNLQDLQATWKIGLQPQIQKTACAMLVQAMNHLCPDVMEDVLGDKRAGLVNSTAIPSLPSIRPEADCYQIAPFIKSVFGGSSSARP